MNMSYISTQQTSFKPTKTVKPIPYISTQQTNNSLRLDTTKPITHYESTQQNLQLTTSRHNKINNSLQLDTTNQTHLGQLTTSRHNKSFDFTKSSIVFYFKNIFKNLNKIFLYMTESFTVLIKQPFCNFSLFYNG